MSNQGAHEHGRLIELNGRFWIGVLNYAGLVSLVLRKAPFMKTLFCIQVHKLISNAAAVQDGRQLLHKLDLPAASRPIVPQD